ncbi:valacyclovir hydrolase-like [Oppia nitens]|uniref:valacyclovir hydrolase-like n=1 Tax=Oppia nitens TaxID=1686743 RepID=UPI0023DB5E0C|nr:valacyclovir hydrolase-like [Oppia nitens]
MPHVQIDKWNIWYDEYGSGSLPVLLIPGAIGTAKSDYYEQLDGDDILDEDKFTIIAVDPPGCGRSRPPVRKYGSNLYDIDAQCLYQLMTHLGYESFAVIGWSDGATAALWMACKYPKAITKMVISSVVAYPDTKVLSALKAMGSVDKWPKQRLDNYLRSYTSKEELQKLWDKYLMFYEHIKTYFASDTNESVYKFINFPVLILRGDKDNITSMSHSEYVLNRIKSAVMYRLPNGGHDLHQRYSPMFKTTVEDFLVNNVLPKGCQQDMVPITCDFDCITSGNAG